MYSAKPTPAYDRIASGFRDLGHVVWTGTLNADGALEWHDGARIVGTQVTERTNSSGPVAQRLAKFDLFRQARDFIRETRPDVVQINSYNLFRLLPIGMPRPPRFVLDMRQLNEMYGTNLARRAVASLRNHSRKFDSRVSFDRTTFLHEAGAQKVLGDDWRRWATVVPMGVDPHFLAAEHKRPRPVTDDRPVEFIYSGGLTKIRRLERIIEAADQVRRHTDRFRVVFMGHDGSDGHYARMIDQLELDEQVCIRQPVPYRQVPEALLEYDIALAYVPELPLDWQYHPTLKVLEYRALGMPIIASDFRPNRELIEEGINGLLVANSAEDIAQAMLRFIQEPSLLELCRNNARARRDGVTWKNVSRQYINLYQRLLDM